MKKEEKKIYNEKLKIIDNDLYCVGQCRCEGALCVLLCSHPENRFNVYCSECGSTSDIRFPKAGDTYNVRNGESPVAMLCRVYDEKRNKKITDSEIEDTPISPCVNEVHGSMPFLDPYNGQGK